MIDVTGLVFDYGDRRALDHVTFRIPPGSITALVGPNGAGKSTLMRLIAALARPLAGSVRVAGQDVHAHPREAHRLMGYLPDFFGLYDDLTVERCLEHRASAQGIAPDARGERVRETARRVGLDRRMGDRAGTLSRGLRQRLAIAQAIVHGPKMVILDEPASGLDPEARAQLSALLRTLRAEGMTLMVSSHILAELEDYSTHMLMIRDGKIVEFRAVDGGAQERCVVVADLAGPLVGDAVLAGLSVLSVEGTRLRLDLAADPAARAETLRVLVERGVPVAGFHIEKARLQDTYMAWAEET